MLTGLPVVSTYHSGVPELVEHGRTGLLAPERDVRALAQHLETLARDPGMCQRMGLAARESVLKIFDNKSINRQLESVYKELISCNGKH